MPRQFNDPDYPDSPTVDATDGNFDPQEALRAHAAVGQAQPTRGLPTDSATRKLIPITTGCVHYFPLALAYVAMVSFKGNQKHNPGKPLHWNRSKSTDHKDCCGRHLAELGTRDPENMLFHDGMLAWRSLANLQEFLEKEIKEGRDPWK